MKFLLLSFTKMNVAEVNCNKIELIFIKNVCHLCNLIRKFNIIIKQIIKKDRS